MQAHLHFNRSMTLGYAVVAATLLGGATAACCRGGVGAPDLRSPLLQNVETPAKAVVVYSLGDRWHDVASAALRRMASSETVGSVGILDESGELIVEILRSQVMWYKDANADTRIYVEVSMAAVEDPGAVRVVMSGIKLRTYEKEVELDWARVPEHVKRTIDAAALRNKFGLSSVRLTPPDSKTTVGLPRQFWIRCLRTLAEMQRVGVKVGFVHLMSSY